VVARAQRATVVPPAVSRWRHIASDNTYYVMERPIQDRRSLNVCLEHRYRPLHSGPSPAAATAAIFTR